MFLFVFLLILLWGTQDKILLSTLKLFCWEFKKMQIYKKSKVTNDYFPHNIELTTGNIL